MKQSPVAIAIAALLLAGCESRSDENIAAAIENEMPQITNDLENAAAWAGNEIGDAADAIANEARDAANNVDIDVDTGDEAEPANRQ